MANGNASIKGYNCNVSQGLVIIMPLPDFRLIRLLPLAALVLTACSAVSYTHLLQCKHFRDEVKMNCDVVSTPSRRYPVRRNVAGALSLVALVAGKRKPPHVER